MTTGLGIPADPGQQRAYVRRLSDAHVAGMTIGENMQAPADISALQSEADACGFPVLMTHYSVPFSAMLRWIIEAGQNQDIQRKNTVTRIYETARLGLQGIGIDALLARLQQDLSAELYLFDAVTLQPWQGGMKALPAEWAEAVTIRRRKARGMASGVLRIPGAAEARVMPLPGLDACEVLSTKGTLVDFTVLHHAAVVLGLELERQRAQHDHDLKLGAVLLDDLLHQRLVDPTARARLAQLQFTDDVAVVAITRSGALSAQAPSWQYELHRAGLGLLILQVEDHTVMLMRDGTQAAALAARLDCPLGLSAALGHPLRLREALREARLALAHCSDEQPVMAYPEVRAGQVWLPGSLDEASRLYRRILGALADYDAAQGTELQHNLRVFLDCNRSWQRAAQTLGLHKQTLVYRIRRIQEITGRSLDSTEDVATFWLALQAEKILDADAAIGKG